MTRWMRSKAGLALMTVALLIVGGVSFMQMRYVATAAAGNFMEVREAHAKARKGEVVLVDVRRPSEWRQSGVPASGHAITMHQNGATFIAQLLAATGGSRDKPLALICATGGRTTWLQSRLRQAGFSKLINVTEGMKGSRYGAGWLKKGLPVRKWLGAGSRAPGG